MKREVFNSLCIETLDSSKKVMVSKNEGYAGKHDDVLQNFYRAAEILRISPAEACLMFFTKHLVSIMDIAEGNAPMPSDSVLQEKIGDAINYLILLKALIVEKREQTGEPATEPGPKPMLAMKRNIFKVGDLVKVLEDGRVFPTGTVAKVHNVLSNNRYEVTLDKKYCVYDSQSLFLINSEPIKRIDDIEIDYVSGGAPL